jgi:phosphoglucosamine mutase
MLEAALAAGLMERGLDVVALGVVPTPAVAFLTRRFGAGLGVVISASHNPHPDNGIKFFVGTGFKFPDELERAVETLLPQIGPVEANTHPPVGRYVAPPDAPAEAYMQELLERAGRPYPLRSWHLVLDCAHGATYQLGPELFRRLGAQVTVLCAEPDGENINRDCGSEHPQALHDRVLELHADAGLAFDGDGDRILMVDETGCFLDGDQILAILARDLYERGQLRHGVVVGTVMSNLGLERSLETLGVRLERVPVGDRHVARRMLEGDFVLGGESSGHVVLFGEGSTTGDGLYTAIKVLGIAVRRKRPLSALAAMRRFPQTMVNVPVQGRPPLESLPEVQKATALVEERLGKVRILLRYSGTQPLARVMVEGEDEDQVRWAADLLAEAVRKGVGEE